MLHLEFKGFQKDCNPFDSEMDTVFLSIHESNPGYSNG